jgi:hypothetical protein
LKLLPTNSCWLDDEHRQLIVPLWLDHLHNPQVAAGALRDRVAGLEVRAGERNRAEGITIDAHESEAAHRASLRPRASGDRCQDGQEADERPGATRRGRVCVRCLSSFVVAASLPPAKDGRK